jgi:hypothetical protein
MNAAILERALILACWEGDDPLLAGFDTDPALLDVAGKTTAQRSVEQAVALGAHRIDVVLGERAAAYEACLGNGERWGCAIVYHYAAPGAQPLRSIVRLLAADAEYLLLHADTNLPAGHAPAPDTVACRTEDGEARWCGWARLSGAVLAACAATADSRPALAQTLFAEARLRRDWVEAHASAASAGGLLGAARRLLRAPDYPIGIARRPSAEGLWLGNGVRIHRTAKVVAPAYIGDHVLVGPGAVIGPDAVIGARSIVDRDVAITESVVAPASYVGAGVELRQAILVGRRLVNVALGVAVEIADRELAGSVAGEAAPTRPGVGERLLAAGLWAVLGPLRRAGGGPATGTAVEAVHAGVPGSWARHFREVFHPGLAAVVRGRLRIVGPAPRSAAEIARLPDAWRNRCLTGTCGLINEALLLGPDGADPAIRYAGDVLAAKKLQIRHIAGAVLRYARMVLADVHAQHQDRLPASPDGHSRHAAQEAPALARDS